MRLTIFLLIILLICPAPSLSESRVDLVQVPSAEVLKENYNIKEIPLNEYSDKEKVGKKNSQFGEWIMIIVGVLVAGYAVKTITKAPCSSVNSGC